MDPAVFTMSRRAVVGAALASWFVRPLSALAGAEWCFGDPPVHLILSSGSQINVTCQIGVPTGYRSQLQIATVNAYLGSDTGVDVVYVTVVVPDAPSGSIPVLATVTVRPNQLSASGQGTSGQALLFAIPLA